MRASKFLSRWKQYCITCVSTQTQLCLCLSHSSSCACIQAAVFAQVEVRRSSSTGMMGVRRKNVMRKVASLLLVRAQAGARARRRWKWRTKIAQDERRL